MNGILLINKPKNYTSHDIVYKVKQIYHEKVGHTGTLDPNATGVLPLLIGKATLLSKYLINHDKVYEATIELGEKRDTADSEGKIVQKKAVKIDLLSNEHVQEILNTMLGKQQQIPPMYSAIKINGKKLYEYARKGEELERKAREIEIYEIDLINVYQNIIQIRVSCSKGTYIRTLCEEIAERLETVGYMKELKRVQVGEFKIDQTVTIEELENNKDKSIFLESKLMTVEKVFQEKEKMQLSEKQLKRFLNGVKISLDLKEDLYRIYDKQMNFIGIAKMENGNLKRDIIL